MLTRRYKKNKFKPPKIQRKSLFWEKRPPSPITPPFNSQLRDPWGPQWWSPLEKQLNIHDCIVHQLPTIQYNAYIQGLYCPLAPSSPAPAESIQHFEFRNGNEGVANFQKSDRPECPTNANSVWQWAVSVWHGQKRSKMNVKCRGLSFLCWNYWFYRYFNNCSFI